MEWQCSPMENMIFEQIKWIDRRRTRIVSYISAHYGKKSVRNVLEKISSSLKKPQLHSTLEDHVNELAPSDYLRNLAFDVELDECLTIEAFVQSFSKQETEFKKQILRGSRYSGQEAARNIQSHSSLESFNGTPPLSILYSAISKLLYNGLPDDKFSFTSVRPLSDISIFYSKCPHIDAWRKGTKDVAFMCDIRHNWIQGLLEILAPNILHIRSASIAKGNKFGKEYLIPKEKYVP